jgi:hypothetical protein
MFERRRLLVSEPGRYLHGRALQLRLTVTTHLRMGFSMAHAIEKRPCDHPFALIRESRTANRFHGGLGYETQRPLPRCCSTVST